MLDENYSIKLTIFEGPMDLLVYLVKKHDMDIADIPISKITEQYLQYLDMMTLMNIDFAGDFLYMAATLAHIKSRTLLPSQGDDGEEEDPRLEIARPLMEYLRLKSAAVYLGGLDMFGRDTFEGGMLDKQDSKTEDDLEISIGLFELAEAFGQIMDRQYRDHTVDFSTNTMSVKERILELISIFEIHPGISFLKLMDNHHGKPMVVLTFLAILEMAKMNLIEIKQHIQNGMITLYYV
ncbi:MAG: segregation/condensation protein A [Proteobacteria bacterium]|nr:segregation/condensation protein A [Pseudomonadota bacterium]